MKKIFFDLRLHVIVLLIVFLAELIGIIPFKFGIVSFSLFPMLYALIIGIIASKISLLKITDEFVNLASDYVGYSVMILIAYMASSIGPNLEQVLSAGPALVLQEFGNLGTLFLSVPIAVYIFKMDRTAIGSTFSTSRETSIAVVGNLYGLDGPEGRGVMGSYITGTLLGTVFCAILSSILMNISWFAPEALAMASGTGSASMMSAAIAPLIAEHSEKSDLLMSFASTSQVLTSATGIYMTLFIAIPLTEWLYGICSGEKHKKQDKIQQTSKTDATLTTNESQNKSFNWGIKLKTWLYSSVFGIFAIYIASNLHGEGASLVNIIVGMLWLLAIVLLGNLIDFLALKLNINLPTILYIALVSSVMSIPAVWPGAIHMNTALSSISLLPLTTPILAYAGISTGKELEAFKKQGLQIIVVTLFALAGTYVGSAVIANIIWKLMN